jgi:8-oxo-dGTP pyrophosphatase MutT (NUDIX family)
MPGSGRRVLLSFHIKPSVLRMSDSAVIPVPAATIVPVRERAPGGELEVLLLRRRRGASFMADAFVFPGGRVEPEDAGAAAAAIRELFEEAGVLLATPPLEAARRAAWRERLLAGEVRFTAFMAGEGLTLATERLRPWARWITPSVEPKRFDARFFVAAVPADQEPSCDAQETVSAAWLTPAEALARGRRGELRLPPPQVVTLLELLPYAAAGLAGLAAAAAAREHVERAVLPRLAQVEGRLTVLLPWDPDYATLGAGEARPTPAAERPAGAPRRLTLEGTAWNPE